MKIFCTEYPLLSRNPLGEKPGIGQIFLRGDSSINNSGKVLSLPWWSKAVGFVPLLAVRVGRVGRAFEAVHADRYYEEMALGIGFADLELFKRALDQSEDPSLSYNFDGSLFLSSFYPKARFPEEIPFVDFSGEDRSEGCLSVRVSEERIAGTLALLSRYYLMKMGDVVTFPLSDSFERVAGDMRRLYEGSEDEVLLDFGVRVFRSNFTP